MGDRNGNIFKLPAYEGLRSVTCHMGSHRVICHPTRVNAPRLNSSQIGRYSIYLPRKDGRWTQVDIYRRLVTYRDGLTTRKQSPIQALSRPGVE